jgi:hypothetical protein
MGDDPRRLTEVIGWACGGGRLREVTDQPLPEVRQPDPEMVEAVVRIAEAYAWWRLLAPWHRTALWLLMPAVRRWLRGPRGDGR